MLRRVRACERSSLRLRRRDLRAVQGRARDTYLPGTDVRAGGLRSGLRRLQRRSQRWMRDRSLEGNDLRRLQRRLPGNITVLCPRRSHVSVHHGLRGGCLHALRYPMRQYAVELESLRRVRHRVPGSRQWHRRLHDRRLHLHLQATVPRMRRKMRRSLRSRRVWSCVHGLSRSAERQRDLRDGYLRCSMQRRLRRLRRERGQRLRIGACEGSAQLRWVRSEL